MTSNPILKGFNPDPSIIRVDDDFYIATSAFEWFPGVQIHHSKDLSNWQLITRPLDRLQQLDLRGVPDSCGVWAPCLSYCEGVFYLGYSNVKNFEGPWKDTPNYLVTSNDIHGPWSDPLFLTSSGFDASLFHGPDGRKWLLNMQVDHRHGKFFGGIELQELDSDTWKTKGPKHLIFEGSEIGITEGPHLYYYQNYYYLITAEGGTEYGHAVSLARSKDLLGPYEVCPHNPLITARDNPKFALQKTGHGDLVQDQNGEWYIVFLVGRPLSERGRCTLGRETAIEKLVYKDDQWFHLEKGGNEPGLNINLPLTTHPFSFENSEFDHFEDHLGIVYQALRRPITENWADLKARNSFLRLYGQESLNSFHNQSLIARRMQHFEIEATTCLEFSPQNFQQMAGLICYYNSYNYLYLHMAGTDVDKGKELRIICSEQYRVWEPLVKGVDVSGFDRVYLKVRFIRESVQFFYGTQEDSWQKIGPELDGSKLSDDYIQNYQDRYMPAFTGVFIGICCQDLSGMKGYADFDWFSYSEAP